MQEPITAIYENGVFRPLQPIEIEEHTVVSLTIGGDTVSSFDQSADASDPTELQVLHLIEKSGVLDFWKEESEDIYTDDDGEAI